MRRALPTLVAAALAVGCAKFPDAPPETRNARLIFTLTVAGKLRTGLEQDSGGLPYVYMVALRPSFDANPIEQGPIPVIAPPWGNGFVAGTVTHFMWWNPQQSPRYTLYQFRDANLTEYFQTGVPINYQDVPDGGATLRFEIDLAQIVPNPLDLPNVQSIQANFLTMDRIAQSGTSKFWDALGNSNLPSEVNFPITIPINLSGVFDNARLGQIEPQGDTPEPDLDIVDWSIEVRRQ